MKMKGATNNFPVVCVGGSAGGLDAYIRLLQNLPANLGVAIVIVNHLRTVATRLHEILPRFTAMPVELITEELLIRPNRVFIIPERRDLHVLNGEFRLKPISKPRGWPDVITVFLKSLTKHWKGKLVAVIVSGYDGDGAAALCGIKEVGVPPSRRSWTPLGNRICRRAQLPVDALILSSRPRISPVNLRGLPSRARAWHAGTETAKQGFPSGLRRPARGAWPPEVESLKPFANLQGRVNN